VSEIITLESGVNGFAEDKDQARDIRRSRILPALENGEHVTLDFASVKYATQSYIHALVGEALQKHGQLILDKLEFRNCSAPVKSVIELVVDYSLGGFDTPRPSVVD
jgi:hypothetical protein